MAQPKLLRASRVNKGTGLLPLPQFTPRITSLTANTPSAGVPGPTTVTRICRLSSVIIPSWPMLSVPELGVT